MTQANVLPRGNYYAEPGYCRTDTKTGVARNRAGTRILYLTSDFLIGLQHALQYECGKAADLVAKKAGARWGFKFAERMEKELSHFYGTDINTFPLAVFQGCLAEAFSHHGWGYLTLDFSDSGTGIIGASIKNPVYAELLERQEAPLDPMTAGVLAGVFSYFSGQTLDCVQTQCQAQGFPDSRFLITLPARIEQIQPQLDRRAGHQELLAALRATTV